MLRNSLGLLAVQVFFATSSYAVDRQYQLDDYPVSEEACYDTGAALAGRLARLTGVAVTGHECRTTSEGRHSIVFSYQSSDALKLVTTANPRGSAVDPLGSYRTNDACQHGLDRERKLFEEATGLEAFIGYCLRERGRSSAWIARVDGFGSARLMPYVIGYYSFVSPLGLTRHDALANQLQSIRALGLPVRHVLWTPSVGYGRVSFAVYADERLRMSEDLLAHYDQVEQCYSQLEAAQEMLRELSGEVIHAYCGKSTPSVASELVIVRLGGQELRRIISVEQFGNTADCQDAVQDLWPIYEEQGGYSFAGGLCSFDHQRGTYRVNFFPK